MAPQPRLERYFAPLVAHLFHTMLVGLLSGFCQRWEFVPSVTSFYVWYSPVKHPHHLIRVSTMWWSIDNSFVHLRPAVFDTFEIIMEKRSSIIPWQAVVNFSNRLIEFYCHKNRYLSYFMQYLYSGTHLFNKNHLLSLLKHYCRPALYTQTHKLHKLKYKSTC